MDTGNERGQELHDRATRGAVLSDDERAALELWYARQDAEEAVALEAQPAGGSRAPHMELEHALDELREVSEQVRELARQNEATRRAIRQSQQ